VFEYFASENLKRWIREGEELSERIIRDVKEEVELGIPCRCLFSTDEDK
jgi:ADP-ribose pyrophosphatase YjhB (NUDIX family)